MTAEDVDTFHEMLLALARRCYEHELAEQFTVDGERPRDPHKRRT